VSFLPNCIYQAKTPDTDKGQKMSIKQKTLALATEHSIEIWWPKGVRKDEANFVISLPKGMQLADGRTGLSVDYNNWISDYQNWKGLLADVEELIAEKSTWCEIEKVGA
jgi:hypothetical protein